MDRIGEYIKEKDPNWAAWGDEFDVSILDGYKAGVNMRVVGNGTAMTGKTPEHSSGVF